MEFVFYWREGKLHAGLEPDPRKRPPSVFEPDGDDVFRTVAGRERGERLRLVRDDAGEVVRMSWATYPFTRALEIFGSDRARAQWLERRLPIDGRLHVVILSRMRARQLERVVLATALAGSLAVGALVDRASAVSSSPTGPPTETVVRPVYQDVNHIDIMLESAVRLIDRAAKAKTAAKRGEYRQEAVTDLGAALNDLKTMPDPLPSPLDSRFSRTELDALLAHLTRARRLVTTTNGAAAARRETTVARRHARLLLDYLGLTVTRIRATFRFPITSYMAYSYDLEDEYSYSWSNTNDCGDFTFAGATASWSHPDSDAPGACPAEPVHPATVEVTVRYRGFTCTGRYAAGSAPGDERAPAVVPCSAR